MAFQGLTNYLQTYSVLSPFQLGFAVFVCVLILISHFRTKPLSRHLPPGPPGLPVLGNLHQLPMTYQERTFAEWGKRYGDVVYARILNKVALVLNRASTARALLEKRGTKYSGRPPTVFVNEIVDWIQVVNMTYTDQWRRHRRWFQTALQARNTRNAYEPLQCTEVRAFLGDLLRKPDDALIHVKRYVAALMLGIAYGYSPSTMDDVYIKRVHEALQIVVEAGGPSALLVDFIPLLKYVPAWMPGMGFKRRGLRARGLIKDMERIPLERVKREMAAGIARPSVATVLLEEAMDTGTLDEAEEWEIASALGMMYAAGTDTTTTVLSTFILAMVLHPEVLKKAQAEIDSVVGNSRLPEFSDRPALPYLEAVLKEVYRWLAPVPMGVPHQLTEDDEYEGFHMPKGSMVFTNIWAMLRDDELYSDPDTFDPERFLGLSDDKAEETDPRRVVFGFGRRLCPGRLLADSTVFIAAASAIAVFDIRKPRAPDGTELPFVPSFNSGIVRHPKAFACEIRARSARAADLILAADGRPE